MLRAPRVIYDKSYTSILYNLLQTFAYLLCMHIKQFSSINSITIYTANYTVCPQSPGTIAIYRCSKTMSHRAMWFFCKMLYISPSFVYFSFADLNWKTMMTLQRKAQCMLSARHPYLFSDNFAGNTEISSLQIQHNEMGNKLLTGWWY